MIYFIRDGEEGPVKIGYSKDVAERLVALKSVCGKQLRVLRVIEGDFSKEKSLHRQFAELRLRGEWFTYDPGMMEVGDAVEPPSFVDENWVLAKAWPAFGVRPISKPTPWRGPKTWKNLTKHRREEITRMKSKSPLTMVF